MSQNFNSYFDVTLAAYETRALSVTGAMFFCRSSTAQFWLNIDGGEDFPLEQGFAFRTPDGNYWNNIVLKNRSATALQVTGYIGSSLVTYAPPVEQINLAVKLAPTILRPNAATNLAAGATLTLAGTYLGKNRKQIVVTNLSAAGDLQILDSAGTVGAIAFPRSAWTIETSDTVKVKNNTGLLIDLQVLEIFYT